MKVTLKSGEEFSADAVFKSRLYPSLFIYTNALTMQQAAELFSNPENFDIITVETGDKSLVYTGFSELNSISKAEMFTENKGELFIWLNYVFNTEA